MIGRGAPSAVRKGRLGGKTVAVRTLKADRGIHPRDHPHLLQLIAVDIDPLTGQCSMVCEMMDGNIKDCINKNAANRLRLQLVREPPSYTADVLTHFSQLSQVTMGSRRLHEHEIVHGDLKGVRLSPLIPFRILKEFAGKHLDYQRNTRSSSSCRLWTFKFQPSPLAFRDK